MDFAVNEALDVATAETMMLQLLELLICSWRSW
jgi:hypothetical protein